jgi:hypothetical protein
MSTMSDTPDPADLEGRTPDLAAGSVAGGAPPSYRESLSLMAPDAPGEQRRGSYGPTSGRPGGPGFSRRWVQRAEGDRRARARLQIIEGEGVVVLNDRRVPGSRSNIKWIAVSAAGVFVIDIKNYKGLVHIKRRGPISDLGPYELHVGRKNCTSSVESVNEQSSAVRAALDTTAWGSEVPVYGMLCLVRAEWGFASAVEIGDVCVGWPKLVAGRVQAPGVMDSPAVQEVSQMIAEHLPVY